MSLSSVPISCILVIGRRVRNITRCWKKHETDVCGVYLAIDLSHFFFFAETLKFQNNTTAKQHNRHFLSRCRWVGRYMPAPSEPAWMHQSSAYRWEARATLSSGSALFIDVGGGQQSGYNRQRF